MLRAIMCAFAFVVTLLSFTASADTLVIAAEGKAGSIAPLIENFQRTTGIEVQVVSQGKAELLDFVPHSGADLMITSVGDELEIAKQRKLLQRMTIDLSAIPNRFHDPDNYWTGYAYRVRSIFYNTKSVSNVPTYEQLAGPEWKGRLCSRTMDHKYNHAFVSWILATRGEAFTKNWLQGVRANSVYVEGGDKAQAKGILDGKCDVSITNSYYMTELLTDPKTRAATASTLGIHLHNQPQGAYALVNGMGVLRTAKNVKAANQFVAYMLSYMSQQWIANVVTQYPVSADIPLSGVLKTYGTPVIEQTSIATTAAQQDKAYALIKAAGF